MVQIFYVSYTVFKDAAEFATTYYHINPGLDGYALGTGNKQIVYATRISSTSDISDFAINIEPTAVVVTQEEDTLASPTIQQTGILQSQFEFTSSFIYVGKAKPNVATSAVGWTIQRFALDSGGDVTNKQVTTQDDAIWDTRAVESYF